MHYTAKVWQTPPPQPVLFKLFDEEPGGGRPKAFVEPRPQERVQRHVVEHIADLVRVAPMVQILDAPVPQMVDQLPDIMSFFNKLLPVPEQVIEVPKILPNDVPVRTAVRDPQLAEQLVEVPTIVSYSSLLLLQRTMEQNVGIPVVGGSGAGGGLSGFLPGQNYSMTAEQIVDNPVPRPGCAGGLQGSHRGQGSTAFSGRANFRSSTNRVQQRGLLLRNAVLSGLWSRSKSFPIQVEVFKIFSQSRVPQRPLRFLLDTLVKGVFRTFPHRKKCEDPAHPGFGTGCALELMDAMSKVGVWCRWLRH